MQNNTFSRLSLRQNLIVLEEVSSTNDYLKQLLSNIKPLAGITAIMAKHQTQGKGQRGSTWTTPPGENLTFSFNIHPNNLEASKSFNLNMLLCLGIRQWLASIGLSATVKWPNDIYVNNKKIGGVLIENQLSGSEIRASIIGIGLNINQVLFPKNLVLKATSLRKEKPREQAYLIEECCVELLHNIGNIMDQYDIEDTEQLLDAYNDGLFRKNVLSSFMINDQQVEGTILGVEKTGELRINIGGERRFYNLKEISFII